MRTAENEPRYFYIQEDMDALSVKQLRIKFEELIETENRNITLDLSGVEFIDSSGIGAIVFLFKRRSPLGRTIEIQGVHGQPRDLFDHLRIHKALTVRFSDSTEEDVAATAMAS